MAEQTDGIVTPPDYTLAPGIIYHRSVRTLKGNLKPSEKIYRGPKRRRQPRPPYPGAALGC